MRRATQLMKHLARSDSGGEIIEYALIAGLISIAAVALIAGFGVKVVARWNSVSSSL